MLISEKNKGIDFNVIGYEFPREKKSSKKEFNYENPCADRRSPWRGW